MKPARLNRLGGLVIFLDAILHFRCDFAPHEAPSCGGLEEQRDSGRLLAVRCARMGMRPRAPGKQRGRRAIAGSREHAKVATNADPKDQSAKVDQAERGLARKRAHARVSSGSFVFAPATLTEARRRVVAFLKATEDFDNITEKDAECILAMGRLAPTIVGNVVSAELRLEAVKVVRAALRTFSGAEKAEAELARYPYLLKEENANADLALSRRRRGNGDEEDDEEAHRPAEHYMWWETMEEYHSARDKEPYCRWSDEQVAGVLYVHFELRKIDSSFSGLDPQLAYGLLDECTNRRAATGAGNFGEAHIVARLSLSVEALGACIVDGDKVDVERRNIRASDVAIKRITNAIQQSIKRANERTKRRKSSVDKVEASTLDWINDPVRAPGK